MPQLKADYTTTSSLRVGVDLVRIADVAASLARFGDRYAERIFTVDERAYCDAAGARSAERFAARFAAKEAVIKILRVAPNEGLDPRSIEVRRRPEGACEIALHDGALALAERAHITDLSLSMSHEHDYATATVVARVAPPPVTEPPHGWTVVHADPQPGSRHASTPRDA